MMKIGARTSSADFSGTLAIIRALVPSAAWYGVHAKGIICSGSGDSFRSLPSESDSIFKVTEGSLSASQWAVQTGQLGADDSDARAVRAAQKFGATGYPQSSAHVVTDRRICVYAGTLAMAPRVWAPIQATPTPAIPSGSMRNQAPTRAV